MYLWLRLSNQLYPRGNNIIKDQTCPICKTDDLRVQYLSGVFQYEVVRCHAIVTVGDSSNFLLYQLSAPYVLAQQKA